MTLEEARAFLATHGWQFNRKEHSHPNESLIPAFEASSDADKARMIEAGEVLLTQGNADDQSLAGPFLRSIPLPALAWSRLVAAYTTGSYDEAHPVARILETAFEPLSDTDAATLERLFLADPRRNLRIGGVVLKRRPSERAWDALAEVVRSSSDPRDLALAARQAEAVGRVVEFIALMRAKPEAVQRGTVDAMSDVHYSCFHVDEIAAALRSDDGTRR